MKEIGLVTNLNISKLINSGFKQIYNKPYFKPTYTYEIEDIRKLCNDTTILCAGGGIKGDKALTLVACGDCLVVTSKTERNSAQKVLMPGGILQKM